MASEARFRCAEFKTGKLKRDKLGLGRGSLLIADGHLIALGDQGILVLTEATRPNSYSANSLSSLDSEPAT